MKKRSLLWKQVFSCILVVSMLCSMALPAAARTVSTTAGNQNYMANRGELKENPLIQLPLGAVRARGWLENQLLLQKDNLTGNMKKYKNYNYETSRWLNHTSGEDWEKGVYFFRGLVALAYELNDEALKEEAQQWVEAILSSQAESGNFGPTSTANDWWVRMPALMGMRDYYEATVYLGEPDSRVLTFLENYFRFQLKELPGRPLSGWSKNRGGDNLEVVFWLYNQVYDSADPQASEWLLELGTLLNRQSDDWEDIYNNSTSRLHVVNVTQGAKMPPVYYQYSRDEADRTAYRNGIFNYGIDHGRIDNQPNADEAARENRSTRGNETCSVVEALQSAEIEERISGDVWTADHMERLAYNSLPACFTPDFSGHCYYQLQNQVIATVGAHEFTHDHGDDVVYGAPIGVECCFPNSHMGWPKFVQNMWMATANDGLALVAYGPNSVTAKVADGKTAQFVQETDYPFKDAVHLAYDGETAAFELKLRIPEWASAPAVTVNGEVQEGVVSGEYFTVTRTWEAGDEIDLRLPSEIETSTWYNDSVAVEKGPLIFSLKIDEDWRVEPSNETRNQQVISQEQSPLREIYPASRWNYGLIVDHKNPAESLELIEREEVALQPFSVDNAPVVLKAKGQVIPAWTLDGNIAGPQPFGPTPYDESLVEDIELIPYGCGRLRITHFPKIGEPADTVIRTADPDSKVRAVFGVTYQEFDNIVVPSAENYTLKLSGSGAGTMIINGKYEQKIDFSSGEVTVENLKNLLSGYFRFNAGQYNNIRFTGGVQVDTLEVVPVNATFQTLRISGTSRSGDTASISTNLNSQETPFYVEYGTQEGQYTHMVNGLDNSRIILTDLDPSSVYYVRVTASINGQEVSQECVLDSIHETNILRPDPSAPHASYSGFGSVEETERDWVFYDPQNHIQIQPVGENGSQLHFDAHPQVKAALNVQGSDKWSDFVAEGRVTLDINRYKDVGMVWRGSNFGDPDNQFNGYYAGVGKNGLIIGYADGAWHYLKTLPFKPVAGQIYTIKVVARGSYFAVFVDNVLMHRFQDTRFTAGTVGFRSWNEAFVANSINVRPVTEADLKVFADLFPDETPDNPDYVEAHFSDDFEDAAASEAQWTKFGSVNSIRVADGKLHFDRNPNVKAVAGDEAWTDYAVQADITLPDTNSYNAGIMFRSTGIVSGADGYNGYYFGINNNSWLAGYADGRWHAMLNGSGRNFEANKPQTLKIAILGNKFQFYINGELVGQMQDNRYPAGKIGLRSYYRAFDIDNVLVRPLNDEEIANMHKPAVMEASLTSSENTVVAFYPLVGADSYKIQYGTEPGIYTHEEVNIRHGGHSKDKVAFSVSGEGTYYVRILARKGETTIAETDEMTITTGYRESTEKDREKLAAMLAEAKALDTSAFTQTSLARLNRAISDAEAMPETASQMDVALAARLLYSAMNAPSSEDFTPVTPPETNEVSVRYTVNTNLSVNGVEQPLSDLIGLYTTETDEALALTFTPAIEGRTLLSASCDGKDLSSQITFDDETGESAFTYTAKPGDELQFTFTLVNKMILGQIIDTATALQGGAEYEAAIPTVQTAFDDALKNAQTVYADKTASQEAVDNAWSKMLKAIHLLSFAEGSTDELKTLLAIADALSENGYTPTSWATLQTAAEAARELVADPEPLKADADKAYKALHDALMNLVEATNKESLQYYFDVASEIDLDLYLEVGKEAFRTALANAEEVLNDVNATQEDVDGAASALSDAMAKLLLIPNKDALKASVEKAESVDTGKYTAASVRAFQKALDNARGVLDNPQATEQQVQSADRQLTSAQNALVRKNANKGGSSKTTSTAPANTYGSEGTATVGENVAKAASVVSDTTVNFTLKRGSAYCFKMTVVNGNGQAPSFTVGNGDVLKTQFVAQIGNVYYYRVWAVGAPGASTGVYTALNGQPVKHCTVTIG